jgi:hypothetical protein
MAKGKSVKAAPDRRKVAPPIFIDPNQRYSINEATAALRQCRAQTYKDIKKGGLRIIRAGKRVYVPGTELIRRSTLPAD